MKRFLATTALVLLLTTQLTPSVNGAPAGTFNYTALGDSLAYGILDLSGGGYVPRYANYVQTDTGATVSLNNLGQNGWTSGQLLNALRTNAAFRNSIANSQVVTWDIGGNDLLRITDEYKGGACGGADNQDCLRSAVAMFKANWAAIIVEILSLRRTSDTVIRTMNVYNPFVKAWKASDSWANDGGLNDFQVIKPYLDEVNNYIEATATANNIPYAKVYQAFNGINGDEDAGDKGYISPYDYSGVHPSDLGHKVIADLFRNLGYYPLTQPASGLIMQFIAPAYSFYENDPSGVAAINVIRSGETSVAATVDYFTSDNSASVPCQTNGNGIASDRCDYATANGTLRFAAGETSKIIRIPIINDAYVEPNETFTVTLRHPQGGVLGTINTATVTIIGDDTQMATTNPIEGQEFFIKQQYIDFLGRVAEPSGLTFWMNRMTNCPAGQVCDRIDTAKRFFESDEFKERGYYVFKLYDAVLGRLPQYAEFVPDVARLNGPQTPQEQRLGKDAYLLDLINKQEFRNIYGQFLNQEGTKVLDAAAATGFVDALIARAGITPVSRQTLINNLAAGTKTPAQTLEDFILTPEISDVGTKFYDRAIITMQYFGFLRRNPDPGGFNFWWNRLANPQSPVYHDYREIVGNFLKADEYYFRFAFIPAAP
jgi:lysophospholipase L1-like esterase